MDWYPWYPTDFRRDTYSLSLAEDGAYRRLIDEYMLNRGDLPDDNQALARIIGVGLDEWLAVAPRVRTFFRFKEGRLIHKRCEIEIAAQNRRMERFSARGQKAALKRWSRNNGLHARRMLVSNTVHNKDIDSSINSESEIGVAAQQGVADRGRGNGGASPELAGVIERRGWQNGTGRRK
jgi:uncharacterized protein YdaU (DUF1376 family)